MFNKSPLQHQTDARYSQSGVAAILYVIVIMLLFAAVIVSISARLNDVSHQRILQTQQEWLHHSRQQLQSWYEQNAAWVDASTALNGTAIMSDAGIEPQWNAELLASSQTCQTFAQGSLCYHTFWLALPSMAGPAPTVSGSTFTPNSAQYVSVSGEAIESQLYHRALRQVQNMGTLLESGFAAAASSGALHNDDLDWFAPAGCTNGSGDGPFACSNGGFLDWDDYLQGTGLSGLSGNNPWGFPVQVNNSGGEASDTSTPFSVELRSPLPWGGYITSLVAQPL